MDDKRPSFEEVLALMEADAKAQDDWVMRAKKLMLQAAEEIRERDRKLALLSEAIAEYKEDAERYRWLKAHHLQTGTDSWIRTGDDLEDAIDAARKSESEHG